MDAVRDGWFSEVAGWPGQAFSLKVEEILHKERSQFQDILVFKSESFGRVLALDGIIQIAEKDEFSYNECIAHLPLFSHPDPKSVLVVGGGDGGALREIGKHPSVEEIHICEIDERVIEVCKTYLPEVAVGFADPRVKVHIQDGDKFLAGCKEKFDVIITDSSDSEGVAACLFELPYHERLRTALKPGGIICSQAEVPWMEDTEPVISKLLGICRSLFPVTNYAVLSIPSFPCGMSGLVLASCDKDTVFERPLRTLTEKEAEDMKLRYYDSEVHRGAFILPRFAKKMLGMLPAADASESTANP